MNFKYDAIFDYYKHYIFVCTRVLVAIHVLDIVKLISACIRDRKNLLKYNLLPIKNLNSFFHRKNRTLSKSEHLPIRPPF